MGIFQKLSTLLKSNINDLISRAENPEKMLTQIILDMRDQLARAKREVAAAIADERKLKAQLEDEAKQARDWEQRAMLAVRENRDDLAKQALMRQQEHTERGTTLEQAWRGQASSQRPAVREGRASRRRPEAGGGRASIPLARGPAVFRKRSPASRPAVATSSPSGRPAARGAARPSDATVIRLRRVSPSASGVQSPR